MVSSRVCRSVIAVAALAFSAAPLVIAVPAKADGVLAPIWTGVYVGFQGGGKWSDLDTSFNSGLSTRGVSGGGHVGFNWGVSGLVIGLEADASLDDAAFDYSFPGNTSHLEVDWSGTVRGRIGLPIGNVLLYATAGYAWSEASIRDTSSGGTFNTSHRFDGVVYGIGTEAYVLPNLSVRLEALHFDYGSDQLSIAGAAGALEEFDPSETVVRAGVTFHLN